jgi:hypothetical protein
MHSAYADETGKPKIPKSLSDAILKAYPNYSIIEKKFFDVKECDSDNQLGPGLIIADFNGDRITDYAIELRSSNPRNSKYGQVWDISMTVFLGQSDGTFKDYKLSEFEQGETTVWGMIIINDELYDFEKNVWVKLSNPALELIRCGGGSSSFYWDGKKFRDAGGT